MRVTVVVFAVNVTCAINGNGDMVASVYTEGIVGFDVGVFGCNTTTEVAADGWTETTCVIGEVNVI